MPLPDQLTTNAYGEAVVKHPIWVCFLSLILVVVSAWGVRNIGFSSDYRDFFSDDNKYLVSFDNLQDTFSRDDNIFILIHNEKGEVFDKEILTVVKKMTDEAWQIPFASRVDSLSNFQHTRADNDDLFVDDLIADAQLLDKESIERIRTVALGDSRLTNRLISLDASTLAINVTLRLPGESRKEVPEAVAHVRDMLVPLKLNHPDLQFRLTGNVMMSNALSEASIADIKTLVPLMYAVIIICVFVLFRSFSATLLVSLVVGLSIITAIGISGWGGIVVTPPSASAPSIIMTLGVAGSIHVLTSFFSSLNRGLSKEKAMINSLNINVEPVFLTVLTTVIGFASMNFSDTPPLRDLGNIAAIGISATLIFTLFTLPAVAMLLPFKPSNSGLLAERLFESLGDFVVRNYRILFWLMIGFTVITASLLPKLQLNDQYVEYFDESIEFRRDTDFAMEHLTGIYKIEYLLQADDSGGISRPDYLREVQNFADWFRDQPEVVHVQSIVETIKILNRNMNNDDSNFEVIPESRDLIAQYLLLYEMSLPYGLDMNSQISIGKDATRLVVMLENRSTNDVIEIEKRAKAWLIENASTMSASEGTGSTIIFAHMAKTSINSMISGTFLAIILIGIVLMIALKSVKYGALSFIPNLLPSVIAMGIWALTVGELGFALSVMIAMTLGIVVDDTIHFLSKYLRGRKDHNLSPEDAIRYAYSTVGSALVITTIVLVLGFLVLAQSSFTPNSGMSLLTIITITVALILDLFLLPPLLLKIDNSSERKKTKTMQFAKDHL